MRRYHTKSRRGCSQCKLRKVKCDLSMPSCKNCLRLSKECSLKWITPSSILSKSKPPLVSGPSVSPQKLPSSNPTNHPFNSSGTNFDILDFELIHLYATSIYSYFAPSKAPEIWRVEIPSLALAHPYLMHGILAVSALHLAHFVPQRYHKLVARASRHECLALPQFRKATFEINEQNCHAVFAFSGFVTFYALASLDQSESQYTIPSDDRSLPSWINLMRGSHTLLYTHWKWLANGPFGPLLERTKAPINYANNPNDVHLIPLIPLFSLPNTASIEEREVLTICREAFEELRRVWSLPYSPCKTVGSKAAATIWPGTISLQYIKLLGECRPEALVILAYYCVLLNEVNNCWYYKALAERLINAISQRLSIEWSIWIQWPWDQVMMK